MSFDEHIGHRRGSLDMHDYRGGMGCLPRFCAAVCGFTMRLFLLVILIVNVGITTSIVVKYTTINGVAISNASPPAAVIFSEVMSGSSILWILISFCLLRAPVVLLVGDAIFILGWFVATIILGLTLGQTLRYACQDLALLISAQTGTLAVVGGTTYGTGIFGGSVFGQNTLAQQVFDSCNISKTLLAFHVMATVVFMGVAANAAITASLGTRRRSHTVSQQNNYYNDGPPPMMSRSRRHMRYPDYQTHSGMRHGPVPNVPEIVV